MKNPELRKQQTEYNRQYAKGRRSLVLTPIPIIPWVQTELVMEQEHPKPPTIPKVEYKISENAVFVSFS